MHQSKQNGTNVWKPQPTPFRSSYAYGTLHTGSNTDLYVALKDDTPFRDIDAGVEIRTAILCKKLMLVDVVAKKKRTF